MIVKIMAYIIGSVLAVGFLWFTAKTVAAGLKSMLFPECNQQEQEGDDENRHE